MPKGLPPGLVKKIGANAAGRAAAAAARNAGHTQTPPHELKKGHVVRDHMWSAEPTYRTVDKVKMDPQSQMVLVTFADDPDNAIGVPMAGWVWVQQ